MDKKPIDPPAFPVNHNSGMTLLDYFAGQCIRKAFDPCEYLDEHGIVMQDALDADLNSIPRMCYDLAEAMLKERERRS